MHFVEFFLMTMYQERHRFIATFYELFFFSFCSLPHFYAIQERALSRDPTKKKILIVEHTLGWLH